MTPPALAGAVPVGWECAYIVPIEFSSTQMKFGFLIPRNVHRSISLVSVCANEALSKLAMFAIQAVILDMIEGVSSREECCRLSSVVV